jgi:hypothetical protein
LSTMYEVTVYLLSRHLPFDSTQILFAPFQHF